MFNKFLKFILNFQIDIIFSNYLKIKIYYDIKFINIIDLNDIQQQNFHKFKIVSLFSKNPLFKFNNKIKILAKFYLSFR
jgi:hypothetical protein